MSRACQGYCGGMYDRGDLVQVGPEGDRMCLQCAAKARGENVPGLTEDAADVEVQVRVDGEVRWVPVEELNKLLAQTSWRRATDA